MQKLRSTRTHPRLSPRRHRSRRRILLQWVCSSAGLPFERATGNAFHRPHIPQQHPFHTPLPLSRQGLSQGGTATGAHASRTCMTRRPTQSSPRVSDAAAGSEREDRPPLVIISGSARLTCTAAASAAPRPSQSPMRCSWSWQRSSLLLIGLLLSVLKRQVVLTVLCYGRPTRPGSADAVNSRRGQWAGRRCHGAPRARP